MKMKLVSLPAISIALSSALAGCGNSNGSASDEETIRGAIESEVALLPEVLRQRAQSQRSPTREFGGQFELVSFIELGERVAEVTNSAGSFSTTITGTRIEYSVTALEETKVFCERRFPEEITYLRRALCGNQNRYRSIPIGETLTARFVEVVMPLGEGGWVRTRIADTDRAWDRKVSSYSRNLDALLTAPVECQIPLIRPTHN